MFESLNLSVLRILFCAALGIGLSCGCGDNADATGEVEIQAEDSWWSGKDLQQPDQSLSDSDQGLPADVLSADAIEAEEVAPVENTTPSFGELNVITLDMGTGTLLDLNPFIDDAEDDDEDLVLSWSAFNVALEDYGPHIMMVVAPTDWHGTEVITITVTDTGGLEASTDLRVLVNEVKVPDPVPVEDCGKTVFAVDAPGAAEVLLSGDFNNWGGDSASASVMADDDGDGTFEIELVLEPGAYHYKFIVDGDWISDPANPNKVSDGYGGFNSVVEVPECEE